MVIRVDKLLLGEGERERGGEGERERGGEGERERGREGERERGGEHYHTFMYDKYNPNLSSMFIIHSIPFISIKLNSSLSSTNQIHIPATQQQ